MQWYTLETSEVCSHFMVDPVQGLGFTEAAGFQDQSSP